MKIQPTLVVCLLASTALSSATFAQPATPPAPAADSGKVEKVVVTAQRRSQQSQRIGVALTPVTGQTLKDRGITVVNGLENITPNLEVENQFGSGQPSFTIRGVGFRDYATNNSATVGVYVDEVAYTLPVMTQGVLYDVDRVEVLRGPQGTLYGRNTTGGAINFISRKPTADSSYGFTAEYGRFDELRAEGFVNGAVTDGVNARLSATTQQGGAWQVNRETGEELGDADRVAGRLQLDFDLGNEFDVLFNVHGYQDKSDGLGPQLFRPFAPFGVHTGRRQTSWGTDPIFASAVGITPGEKPFKDNQGWGASVNVRAGLSFADITYIGAYEHLDRREYNDYDAVPLSLAAVLFQSDVAIQSHEVRVTSNGEGPFSWILGGYYSNEDLDEVYNSGFTDAFGAGFGAVRSPYSQEVETLGFFGQAEYKFSDAFKAIGGLRYENETRDLINFGTFANCCGNFNFANGLAGVLVNRSTDFSEVTWKAALEFTPTDNLLYYASVSRGIKSGGFTTYNTLNIGQTDPFRPEELMAYEVGFKTDFADRTVRLNGALYYYDYTDQQVQSAIIDPTFGAVGKIVNAPKSHVYGGELELTWRPVEEVTITQNLGYKTGKFDEFIDVDIAASLATGDGSALNPFSTVTINRSGAKLGFPEWNYGGSVKYERQTRLGFGYTASVDYSYRDSLALPLLGPVYKVDSYWLANASIAIRPDGSPWEFALWGRNIFNEDYDETRNFFTTSDIAFPGEPATYGIRVSADF